MCHVCGDHGAGREDLIRCGACDRLMCEGCKYPLVQYGGEYYCKECCAAEIKADEPGDVDNSWYPGEHA